MIKAREEVSKTDCWNIEALYASPQAWKEEFKSKISNPSDPTWPRLTAYKGKSSQGAQTLKDALELIMETDRELTKLYTYAHLKHDEDIADPTFKRMYEEIHTCLYAFGKELSWFQPELLALEPSVLNQYLTSPILKDYHFHLEKIIRMKKYTLSPDNEQIIALASQSLQTAYKAFNAINDADFKFQPVKDDQGQERPLTHALYGLYIRDQDRTLREGAFKQYHHKYLDYENTLCELLAGQARSHVFSAQARGYASCLEAALQPKNIDCSVYHSLIEAVNEGLPSLHHYMKLRKKILKFDRLHLYDIYVPLIKEADIKVSYQEAQDLVIESVAPLGTEYQNFLKEGLETHRWVDRYENKNKRSGAYSSGCYDSEPYILMNYKETLRDVFTLAHEAGHSMHSLYSRRTQPYQYSDYPIFIAEVASTFNEDLLNRLLLKRCQNPAEKIYLINQQIEDIRATLFRQTMFAEFELWIHVQLEKGIPLTPQSLKEAYNELNRKYFGPDVAIDEEIKIEWSRIPHFYYNFYVFQYATGMSAALALAERVVEGGTQERNRYLDFLKGGSSQYPIEMLKIAGIDMSSPAPVKSAICKFDSLLNELDVLLASY